MKKNIPKKWPKLVRNNHRHAKEQAVVSDLFYLSLRNTHRMIVHCPKRRFP